MFLQLECLLRYYTGRIAEKLEAEMGRAYYLTDEGRQAARDFAEAVIALPPEQRPVALSYLQSTLLILETAEKTEPEFPPTSKGYSAAAGQP